MDYSNSYRSFHFKRLAIISPYSSDVVGETYIATREQVEEAIQKAKEAFAETRRMPAHQRGAILRRMSDIVRDRGEEIARIMTTESGKPIRDSRGEVSRAVHTFLVASEEARRMNGEVIPLDLTPGNEGKVGLMQRFPIGTVLGITPFNFPLNLVIHKVAPAIAVGAPIILKPTPRTPLTSLKLGEWLLEAGWPPQALSVFPCSNETTEMLVQHPDIAVVSFTGSDVVGWHLKQLATRKKVILELGGNAAVIVHSDADTADAAARCVKGAFYYSGQSCISVQRIYLHHSIADDFTERFLAGTRSLKIGDPMDETTDLSAVIDDKAAERIEGQIQKAVSQGAKLLSGGKRNGRLIEPTVLTNVRPDMDIVCTELFAPVVVLDQYDEFDDALTAVNNSPFGLQAGVFTRDIGRIHRAFETLEVGAVIVNDMTNWRIDHMPYGGVKASGEGREGPRYVMEEITEPRLLVIAQS